MALDKLRAALAAQKSAEKSTQPIPLARAEPLENIKIFSMNKLGILKKSKTTNHYSLMPLENLKKTLEVKTEVSSSSTPNDYTNRPDLEPGVEKLKGLWKMEAGIRSIIRRSAALANLITEQDLEDDARVIREAANATIIAYDPRLKRHVERPDHKTRLAATTLRRAYHEGLPVKREISFQGDFESGDAVIARLRQSPEARRLMPELAALDDIQKTGG